MAELLALLRDEAAELEPAVWVDRLDMRLSAPLDLARMEASEAFEGEVARLCAALSADKVALEGFFTEAESPIRAKASLRKLLGDAPSEEDIRREFEAARDLALGFLAGEL